MYFQDKDVAPHDFKRVPHLMSILHQEITTIIIMFFEACDLLIAGLEDRFESQHISTVLSIKQALIQAANGDDFECEVANLRESSYKHDINWSGFDAAFTNVSGHYEERYIYQASHFNQCSL